MVWEDFTNEMSWRYHFSWCLKDKIVIITCILEVKVLWSKHKDVYPIRVRVKQLHMVQVRVDAGKVEWVKTHLVPSYLRVFPSTLSLLSGVFLFYLPTRITNSSLSVRSDAAFSRRASLTFVTHHSIISLSYFLFLIIFI